MPVIIFIDETVVRGDPDGISCSVFCPADHMTARRLIGSHAALTPAAAADESVALKQLAAAAAAGTHA